MNILKGSMVGPGMVEIGGAKLSVTGMATSPAPGTTVEIGLRPEDLDVVPAAQVNGLTIAVEFLEELGATSCSTAASAARRWSCRPRPAPSPLT